MSGFNWYGDDSVVFESVRGIAVYVNENNQIVLRQQADSGIDDDSIVIIPVFMVESVLLAIKNAVSQAQENLDES